MAKQTWNPGTAPTGVGGDTPYSANNKHQSNADELYAHCGADAAGNLPDAQPLNKGGTGATTAEQARQNLGLGSAALGTLTTSAHDMSVGRVLRVGDFGIGAETDNISVANRNQRSAGFYGMSGYTGNNGNYVYNYGNCIKVGDLGWQHILFFPAVNDAAPAIQTSINNNSIWSNLHYFAVIGRNVVVDGNGFVKAASPVLQLFADRIEPNDQAAQQEIVFTRHGVGDYTISGSTGLANEGWYIEQPRDSNGNIYHAIEYQQTETGDIQINTYVCRLDELGRVVADKDKPIDIQQGRSVSVRLNPLPNNPVAPINPTIVDNQGNPAPSKYHELVDGVWSITAENSELLAKEQLAQMPKLTRRQFRLALVSNGYDLAAIEALIASIEDPLQRQIIQIEWQDSTVFERTSNSLNYMATLLELDRDQINALWQQALLL